jgi:hypothetical protein
VLGNVHKLVIFVSTSKILCSDVSNIEQLRSFFIYSQINILSFCEIRLAWTVTCWSWIDDISVQAILMPPVPKEATGHQYRLLPEAATL